MTRQSVISSLTLGLQKDCRPHCPLSRQTNEQTDPRLDAPLTQDHRRGTLGRERRVCEQQKE